jgi:hypothetical protein
MATKITTKEIAESAQRGAIHIGMKPLSLLLGWFADGSDCLVLLYRMI